MYLPLSRGYRQGKIRRNLSPEAGRHLVQACVLAERMSMALRNRSVSFLCCSSSRACTGHPAPALQLSGFGHDGRQQGPWARTHPFVPTQSHFAAGGACCGRAKGCKASSGTTPLPPARRLAVLALCTTFLACP